MKKTVLIVDDNSANLYILKSLLESEGIEVIEAQNGQVALIKAKKHTPDVIISDILMPVMDGYTLCRHWKADEKLKKIPFIFYTATYTESKDEKFALSLGADRFLVKPQEPEIFMGILSEFFSGKKVAKAVSVKPLGEEMEFFRKHNEILFSKLEKKMSDLEIANQQLKILEERYRLSFEHSSDVIFIVDANLIILSMSQSAEEILGYKPQEFIGKPITAIKNIFTPESFGQAVADSALILKGETITTKVYEFVAKDGAIKIGEVSGSPIMRDGQVTGFVGIARDITDRRRAEDELRHSEERYRLLFDNADEAICIIQNGMMIYTNPAVMTLTEYPEDILLSRPFADFIYHQDRPMVSENYQKRTAGEDAPLRYSFRVETKNGTVKWVENHTALIAWDGQQATLNFINNITERKKTQDALQESERKYRGILQNMNDMYYELDLKGNMLFFNKTLLALTGRDPEELRGMNFRDYMGTESSEYVFKIFGEIYKTGKPILLVNEIFTKNGEMKYFESQAGLLLDENKKPIGFRGLARDITDRKKAQDERDHVLIRLRKTLGTMIQAMSAAVETRDPYTSGHQRRVSDLARSIAAQMKLPSDQIEGIRMAAAIHDLGKISIPAEILSMPRKLSKLEFDLVKTHPQAGYDIIKDIDFTWPIADVILQHHERIDGSGYPKGLSGENILLEARILAVADVVEAMASYRPYRPALGLEKALEEIMQNKAVLYDAAAVDACLKLFKEKGYKLI
jgi:PAS domain S-box-containing protein